MNDKEKLEAILKISISFSTGKAITASSQDSLTLQFIKGYREIEKIIEYHE